MPKVKYGTGMNLAWLSSITTNDRSSTRNLIEFFMDNLHNKILLNKYIVEHIVIQFKA